MMTNNTGNIVAIDLYNHRVDLINDLIKKMNLKNVKAIVMDATKIDLEEKFDRVLIDAPCSGLGVLKENLI